MYTPFWYNERDILYNKDYIFEFFPSKDYDIVRKLNELNEENIIIVDNLKKFKKRYRYPLKFKELIDKKVFIEKIKKNKIKNIKQIYHQGACSDTTNWDYDYLMNNNFEYSKIILDFSLSNNYPFIYASSASVYGNGRNGFKEEPKCEYPLNIYAFSKFLFDKHVRKKIGTNTSQIVGLRYFNVYGPQENHKLSMASQVFNLYNQLLAKNKMNIFKGSKKFLRDFYYL